MGRRGPTPEPSAIKVMKGTGGYGTNEPKPRPVVPKCPSYLGSVGKREWKRIVPELDRLGLLTCVDGAALESYCTAYDNMVMAQKVLKKYGMTFYTEKGYIVQRPEVAIVNKSLMIIKAFCAEFGLTPSSRSRMAMPDKPDEEDEMDKLLRGG
ncbi:MAG: phage terminase small subunit P27 family [Armatimonadota bacterium]